MSEIFWDQFEPHLNLGIDFNTDGVNRDSFLYAVGSTLPAGPLGFVVDFIGWSEKEKNGERSGGGGGRSVNRAAPFF